jgi:predicted membrane protein
MDPDNRADQLDPQDPQKPRQPRVMVHGDVNWGLTWGALLVVAGVALLLDHMGIAPFDRVYRFWPLLLVLFGVMNVTTQNNRGFGVVLIVVGVVFQLNTLGLVRLTFHDFWPLIIIAVGVLMIWGSIESWTVRKRPVLKPKVDWTKPGAADEFRRQMEQTYNDPNWLTAVAVFGGCERRFTGPHFQGGKAVSIFGGIELDFRDADMDDEAVLELNCIFGGVEIQVPPNWRVHSRSLPVFGAFEDKSGKTIRNPADESNTKTLVITGVVVFGGVEISN